MKHCLCSVVMACLVSGLPIMCLAQDRLTADPNKQPHENWQSHVNTTRDQLEQRRDELRREREERLGPKRKQLKLDRERKIQPKQEQLKLDREERFGVKREELTVDRENRLGPKRDELLRDRDSRIDLKREELRRERDRQKEILRERKSFLSPPPTNDEIAEANSQRVLEDNLLPGDIVSTSSGLFRFLGSPNGERKPEHFEKVR